MPLSSAPSLQRLGSDSWQLVTKYKMTKKKRGSENLFEALKNDPEAIIKWCEVEIREYQNLIKLVKKALKKEKHGT